MGTVRRGVVLLAIALAAAGAAFASACKKTHTTCEDPPEKAHEYDYVDDGIRRMAEAASRDPSFCRELASPRITLTGDDLVLSGPKERRLARRVDLPAGEIHRVDRLYESLRSYRMQLRLVRPAADVGEVDLRVDPAIETPRAASVILTTVYAGYENARVTTGATTFQVQWFRRSPPDGRYIENILHIEASSETKVTVRVHGPVCAKSPALTVDTSELGALITRLCKEHTRGPSSWEFPQRYVTRCVDSVEVRVLPTSRFGPTAALLRTIVTALADQKPTVDVALLLAGSEPKMKLFPRSPWPGVSTYAPGLDSSAHCTLPDGGYEADLQMPDAGSLVLE